MKPYISKDSVFRLLDGTSLIGLAAALALSSAPTAWAEPDTIKVAAADTSSKPVTSRSAKEDASTSLTEVVVTGSRVIRDGYQAPTPTTVVGLQDIQRSAPINLADQLNELPQLAGSTRLNTSSVSAGVAGMNVLNLRNLGLTRTLVLLDGQRMPASNTSGYVDANVIPNALVQRVDVVTGGASAAWGSDALGGVVNFVLDKTFTGFKGEVSGGLTTYGDDPNYKISFAGGGSFADNRGHFLISAEDEFNKGIKGLPRPWYTGAKEVVNPAYTSTNGQPYLLNLRNVGYSDMAPGAIVASGPLAGLYFGPGGQPLQLQPAKISSSVFYVGPSWQVTDWGNGPQSLDPETIRQSVFARASYKITNNIDVWTQFLFSDSYAFAETSPDYQVGGLNISINNAFLPASVVAAMKADNLTSLTVGSWNQAIGAIPYWSNHNLFRYNIGADGRFDLFGKPWTWDVFGDINISQIHERMYIPINANYLNAINAVTGPNGQIMCASTVANPNNGCQPLDILGTGVASQAGLNYVNGTAFYNGQIQQDEFSATLRGAPVSTWAGQVSVATGLEHRREAETGAGDPLSQTNAYFEGNYKPLKGAIDVTEGFFETVIPLAKNWFLAKSLDLDAAVRETYYSSVRAQNTWKYGIVWTPIEDIKFRATQSQDIRAPGLNELYQSQTATASVLDPFRNNQNTNIFQTTGGNPKVKAEIGHTYDIGTVIQPHFIPGLSLSFDYWDIYVDHEIAALSSTQVLTECYDGVASACNQVVRAAPSGGFAYGVITQIYANDINIAYQKARGLDMEASYTFRVNKVPFLKDIPWFSYGQIALHGLVTRYLEFDTNPGVPGSIITSSLGSNNAVPYWHYYTTATYTNGRLSTSLTARGISDGLVSAANIQCSTTCPAYNSYHPTIDNNFEPGALYFDLNFTYKFPVGLEGFFVVNNVLNTYPAAYPNTTSIGSEQMGVSGLYYDVIGRTFRSGVRFKY